MRDAAAPHGSMMQEPYLFHSLIPETALRLLGSAPGGLSPAEAAARLARLGANVLHRKGGGPVWVTILARQLRSLMVVLLAVVCVAAVASGDIVEAGAVTVVLLLNIVLGFSMEYRAHREIAALLRLETPRALVIRNGAELEVDARQLVPGDLVVLDAGRHVPADARVLVAHDLRVVESALTGESVAVVKTAAPVPEDSPLADRTSMVYSGTAVVQGSGQALVTSTGMDTELGRIGALLATIPDERAPLEKRLDALTRKVAVIALLSGATISVIGALQGLAIDVLLMSGIALAVAAVPEGLPAVATIALAFGVRRMARRNAIVKRPPAVESLGSVTVICTDKTGTLTAGEMVVTEIVVPGHRFHVSGTGYSPVGGFLEGGLPVQPAAQLLLEDLLRVAALVNRASVEPVGEGWSVRGDPTEGALIVAARKAGLERNNLNNRSPEVDALPFSGERMFMATRHASLGTNDSVMVKGSPETVLGRCSMYQSEAGAVAITESARHQFMAVNDELSSRGLRVLAFASGSGATWTSADVSGLTFLGYAGLIDPAATGVRETVESFRRAGIRVVMLTGDQKLTAQAVAHDLAILKSGDVVMDGKTFATMAPEKRRAILPLTAAFSRVSAQDKLLIVESLREQGEVVAMIGDGVNDAAALRKADVGVAMGIRGTDVAKEAAAIVLRNDRFTTIASAIEEGRVIFDNIRKFVFYLFSCNLAEVIVLLFAAILGLPLPLTPLQILWLNMVTDTFPALALAAEPADPGIMNRGPRNPQSAILSPGFLRAIASYAFVIALVSLMSYAFGLWGAGGELHRARTMCFVTLAFAQAFHLGNARERRSLFVSGRHFANRFALGAVALVVLLQLLAVEFKPLAGVLVAYSLGAAEWAIAIALALCPAVLGQALRTSRRPAS